jgi:hypothetical protein
MMNSIVDAQSDMREGYLNGVPGIISSGSAWLGGLRKEIEILHWSKAFTDQQVLV